MPIWVCRALAGARFVRRVSVVGASGSGIGAEGSFPSARRVQQLELDAISVGRMGTSAR
jgi:hypothetical protein